MELSFGVDSEKYRVNVRRSLEEYWLCIDEGTRTESSVISDFRSKAIEQGYLALGVPRDYGGSGQAFNAINAHIVAEEFNAVDALGEVSGVGRMMLVPTLLESGLEWQKQHWIEKTILGQYIWCQGYSEPGSGSDLASLTTKAEILDDGQWHINGQKIWTSSAQRADFMFCLVRTEPNEPRHKGISYLLIDMKKKGVEVRPIKQMNGGQQFKERNLGGLAPESR